MAGQRGGQHSNQCSQMDYYRKEQKILRYNSKLDDPRLLFIPIFYRFIILIKHLHLSPSLKAIPTIAGGGNLEFHGHPHERKLSLGDTKETVSHTPLLCHRNQPNDKSALCTSPFLLSLRRASMLLFTLHRSYSYLPLRDILSLSFPCESSCNVVFRTAVHATDSLLT